MSKNVFNPTVKMVNSTAIVAEIAEAWIASYATLLIVPGVIALGGERLAKGSQGDKSPLFTLSAINDDTKKALFKSPQDELDFYTTITLV